MANDAPMTIERCHSSPKPDVGFVKDENYISSPLSYLFVFVAINNSELLPKAANEVNMLLDVVTFNDRLSISRKYSLQPKFRHFIFQHFFGVLA